MDRNKIKEALKKLGLIDFLLIGKIHGTVTRPASWGPGKRKKSDEKPQTPKTLIVLDEFNESLPSDVSGELKDLMSKMGFIIYERKSYGKPKNKA